jgi:HEAT repeat protein
LGVAYTTVCTLCGVEAPEVGDFGFIGAPSLETKRSKKGTHPFGYLYAGFAALGLLTEEIEAFKAFLEAHHGHKLHRYDDAGGEELGEEEDGDDGAGSVSPSKPTRKFTFKKGKFVEAFHELACEECGEVYRGSSSEKLRPFEPMPLTRERVTLFETNCGDIESHTYRVGGFPFEDIDPIARFLRKHSGHAVVVRLDAGEASPRARGIGKRRTEVPGFTAPEWAPAEDEDALGVVASESTWPLLAALRHREAATRRQAVASVARTRDPGTFSYLASMRRDPDSGVRTAAFTALAAIDDPRRLRVLGYGLLDESDDVRSAARAAIAATGATEEQAAAAALSVRAPDPRDAEKMKLAAPLDDALRDPSSSVRCKAVKALGKSREDTAPMWLLRALADPDAWVRSNAAGALADHGKRDPRVAPALMAALDDYNDSVVSASIKTLGKLKVNEAVPLIREYLLASDKVYGDDTEALKQIGTPEAIDALGAGLRHRNPYLRGTVVYTLSQMKGSGIATHLIAALADTAEEVRAQAAHALGELRSEEAAQELVAGFRRPSEWDRAAVVGALANIGGPEALRVLVAALRDRSKQVRKSAAQALAKRNDPRGNRALIAAARRGDGGVTAQAWTYILGQGEPGTEAGLENAMYEHEDDCARMAACFTECGNAALAKKARAWLKGGHKRKDFPKIQWGSRRKA